LWGISGMVPCCAAIPLVRREPSDIPPEPTPLQEHRSSRCQARRSRPAGSGAQRRRLTGGGSGGARLLVGSGGMLGLERGYKVGVIFEKRRRVLARARVSSFQTFQTFQTFVTAKLIINQCVERCMVDVYRVHGGRLQGAWWTFTGCMVDVYRVHWWTDYIVNVHQS
jgi:hypothetical protein